MPTSRGRNHDEHASGTMPRRANTNPNRAVSAASRMSIGRVIVTPTPTGGAVDRPDDRLRAVEDPQRHHAAAVAGHADLGLDVTAAPGERVATAAEVGARAERPLPRTGDDHGSHGVVGVDLIERIDHLVHHRAGERVHPLRSMQRDRRHRIGHVIQNLRVLHSRKVHEMQTRRENRRKQQASERVAPGSFRGPAAGRSLGTMPVTGPVSGTPTGPVSGPQDP